MEDKITKRHNSLSTLHDNKPPREDIRYATLEEIKRMKERGELYHDPNAPEGEVKTRNIAERETNALYSVDHSDNIQ